VSILAFGGEMGFFVPSDSNGNEATAALGGTGASYNSTFCRGYTGVLGGFTYMDTPNVSAQADFWFHNDIDQDSAVSSSVQSRLIEFLDSGGIAQVRLTSGYSSNTWQLDRWDGSAWVSVGSCLASANSLQTIDVHIVSNTASGSINFYMSGTNRINSGTVNLSGFTGIAKVRCWGVTRGISSKIAHSQAILATTSTIGRRVGTIVMTGQGATHTFTSGGYANIDEFAYSDADQINSDTANQVELFTGTPVPDFTGYTIEAIAVTARAKKESSGPAQMQLALRSGGTTYFSSTFALDVAYGNFCNVWSLNPNGSVAWQSTDISTLQYGVKSIT
jgi:hypothetical protein